MQKYEKLKKLGSGSFGNVELAQNKQTKEIVAIKQLKKKYGTWEECLQLSQVKALRKMSHPNIIKLKEMIRVGNDAHLVFEYIEKDLYKLITERCEKGKKLQNNQIRHITWQMAQALSYIHKQGFFHRDLKPQNLLIDQEFNVKLIDFGIAKQIRTKPPFTQYCSTRWYRAPELLFRFSAYSAPVDVFAMGCIIAEMYMMKPLFLGNSEVDQINKITSVLGTPKNWPEGLKQAAKKGINLPEYLPIPLQTILPRCPPEGIDFINECLKWEPSKRITAAQMLQHPFIKKLEGQGFKESYHLQESKKQSSQISTNKYIKAGQKSGENPLKSVKKQTNYKQIIDHDELFEELLNNFSNCNIGNRQTKPQGVNGKGEDDDQWN